MYLLVTFGLQSILVILLIISLLFCLLRYQRRKRIESLFLSKLISAHW